ncbi:MAG TPA: hypothetical protein VLG11_01740 [Candidatus Saccharimonadales bacterium]|nr:hypothetical protein [Candidatus Saccharimonadales bacterium]
MRSIRWREVCSTNKVVSFCALILLLAAVSWVAPPRVHAITQPQNPQNGSIGIEGTIPTAAPTQAPTIAVPSNGQVFTGTPITVSGLCPKGLLVKIFSNNVFVGSAQCTNGSYSLQVDIFSGRNDLVARAYDSLDQASPDSNVVTVTFNDQQFNEFGSHMLLTSAYAKRGANPGEELDWPVIVSSGSPPYAISVDWGDNKPSDLLSLSQDGTFTIKHTYDAAGVYNIIIKGVDKNGTSAFLQVIGVANGAIQSSTAPQTGNTAATNTADKTTIWKAAAVSSVIALPITVITFFLGQKFELLSLRRHLERSAERLDRH